MTRLVALVALVALVGGVMCTLSGCASARRGADAITLQLNWLHDPTFAGEYMAAEKNPQELRIKEGGPNISPVAEVASGRATAAVVGADIFLGALDKDLEAKGGSELTCVFVDFQRNPVGWVLHPRSAARAGFDDAVASDGRARNAWLFRKLSDGTLQIGDKRGTETTSIWIQWHKSHSSFPNIKVVPVGFDTGVVLSAPMLAYPVYINEEPYKLGERIGKPVIIFDPVDDNVGSYGNVVIMRRSYATAHPDVVSRLQDALHEGWADAQTDPDEAVRVVERVYTGVSASVIKEQIIKTTGFTVFGGKEPGHMDAAVGGGWSETLQALQDANLVGRGLTLEKLRLHLIPRHGQ